MYGYTANGFNYSALCAPGSSVANTNGLLTVGGWMGGGVGGWMGVGWVDVRRLVAGG